jgi:putative SOS response-associated peptidase YedK
MPIILAPDTYAAWLDPTTTAPETLLRSASIEDLVVERVSEVGVAAAAV